MKKISNLLMMALLTIGMGLTSCDEQLDNAVNPGVGEVTNIEFDLSKIDAKYLDSEKTKLKLTVGDVVTLSFTILPEEAADTEVELTAGDATILSIDGLKVTVLKDGETKVTAKAGDKTAEIPVIVAAKGPVDLSMVDNAGNAREKQWTANCYMVHTAGDYKLPLVYGNAIKDGAANTDAYTGITNTNTTATFPNHAGKDITDPWIKNNKDESNNGIVVSRAELLWQDAEGLITAVGIIGDYLTLTVGKDATTQQGNALVAAKDAGGNIVWSWHIWVTTETFAADDLTTVTTTDNTSTGTQGVDWQIYKVTPVNLGWVPTDGNGKKGYAPYYQWGRKDAFIPGTWNANTNRTVYDIDGNTVATPLTYTESTTATIADNIKNPTTFYKNSSTEGPCDTKYYNMWDAQQTGTGNITTATKKTVYDPCPAGFCVPTGNLYYFMSNGTSRDDPNWDGTNKGMTWLQTIYSSNTTGPDLYFPASGYRNDGSGSLDDVGSYGSCWSASPDSGGRGHYLLFDSNSWFWGNYRRAYGHPVRAVAEE